MDLEKEIRRLEGENKSLVEINYELRAEVAQWRELFLRTLTEFQKIVVGESEADAT